MSLELIPADKRSIPFVPTQEIFRLPLNDGELSLLVQIFRGIQAKNPEWIKEPLVDRLYSKIAFLALTAKVMFLPPGESRQQLDGVIKLHEILTQQAQELKRLETMAAPKIQEPKMGGGA